MDQSLPSYEDGEKGMLSCILHAPTELAPEVLALPEDLFYHHAPRTLLEVFKEFLRDGRPVEFIVLGDHLRKTPDPRGGTLESQVGGPGYLAELLDFVPSATHWGYYLKILKGNLYRRTVIQKCELQKRAAMTASDDDARKVLLEAMAVFSDLAIDNPAGQRQWVHVKESVAEALLRTEERIRSRGQVMKGSIATGFTDLDRRTQGLQPGELFIIGARPAMGKSALAANLAECIVTANGHYREFDKAVETGRIKPEPVGLVTLEMNHVDITERMLVGRSGVDMGKTRTGMFGGQDMRNFQTACHELEKAPLYYLDTGRLSIQELMARCRHDVERLGLKVLIVDYLQRMCSDSKKAGQGRSIEIGEISAGLKALAKDFGVVVIALAQVGRSAEERAGCKPQLADLRESGDIEADADFVGLLYRPGYYERVKAKKKGGKDDEEEDDISDDKAELIMAKCRRGAPEPVELRWDGPRTRFTSTHDRLFSNNDSKREG